jgi:IPT/TIG domain
MNFLRRNGLTAVLYRYGLLVLALAASACATKSPMQPTGLQVIAISPNVGSTTGSTRVTITGNDFASDATVTIGGMAATDVVFHSATQLAATTAAAPAGTVDVVVTSGGHTATLTGGFGFLAPTGTNQPPVIVRIRSVGSRPGQQSGFADQDETVTLIADATDAETPPSELTYLWTGPGSFGGTTSTTSWHLPVTVSPAPSPVAVTLTAVETYSEGKLTHTNTSEPRTFVMQVHDSQKEILDMGQDFLTLFSQSTVSTDDVLHNFSTTCDGGNGRQEEKGDVDANRTTYIEDFSKFRITPQPPVTFNFGGRCPPEFVTGDGCSSFRVHWETTYKKAVGNHKIGDHETTDGVDYVTAVLESNRWRLCYSRFQGVVTNPLTGATTLVHW